MKFRYCEYIDNLIDKINRGFLKEESLASAEKDAIKKRRELGKEGTVEIKCEVCKYFEKDKGCIY